MLMISVSENLLVESECFILQNKIRPLPSTRYLYLHWPFLLMKHSWTKSLILSFRYRRRGIQIVSTLILHQSSSESISDSHHLLSSQCHRNSDRIEKEVSWRIWQTQQYNAACQDTCVMQESVVMEDPVLKISQKLQRNSKQAYDCTRLMIVQGL